MPYMVGRAPRQDPTTVARPASSSAEQVAGRRLTGGADWEQRSALNGLIEGVGSHTAPRLERVEKHRQRPVQFPLPVRPAVGAGAVEVGRDGDAHIAQLIDEVDVFLIDERLQAVGAPRRVERPAGVPSPLATKSAVCRSCFAR